MTTNPTDNPTDHAELDAKRRDLTIHSQPSVYHNIYRFDSLADAYAYSLMSDDNVSPKLSSRKRGEWSGMTHTNIKNVMSKGYLDPTFTGSLETLDLGFVQESIAAMGNTAEWYGEYGEYGDIPDVGMYVAGETAHMVRWETRTVKGVNGNVVRMVVNIDASAGVSAELMAKRGLATVALCQVLASVGYELELWAYSAGKSDGHHKDVCVRIKDAGEPYDLSAIAMSLGNPAMLRRVMFGIYESALTQDEQIAFDRSHGYGSPAKMTDEALEVMGPMDIVINSSMSYGSKVAVDPIGWIVDHLKDLRIIE